MTDRYTPPKLYVRPGVRGAKITHWPGWETRRNPEEVEYRRHQDPLPPMMQYLQDHPGRTLILAILLALFIWVLFGLALGAAFALVQALV